MELEEDDVEAEELELAENRLQVEENR